MSRSQARVTPPLLAEMKRRSERIVMTTAYDAAGGRFVDSAGIDVILVGDTAAEVVQGHDSTVPATMDEQVMMTNAVSRVVKRALVIGDLPFGAYESSNRQAVENAIRLVKDGGADVVKLEGARLPRVRAIVASGIGVMGHLGLTPQSATALGGRKVQGRSAEQALEILAQARALEGAGCFAIVLEAVPEPIAARITQSLVIPTIGIGAGRHCDGQVLVYHDLLGLLDWSPRFAKRYANLKPEIERALRRYATEVRDENGRRGLR